MPLAAWVAVAFVAGTLPSPFVLAWALRRHDVIAEMRRQDSPGDAHFLVARKLSGALGVTAIVMDMLKGFAPALVARATGELAGTLAWIGVASVAGHSFAPFLRRAGGRGLTTAAGVSLVIVPKAMVASGVISLAGTIAKRGGLGTSVGFGLLPVFAVVFTYDRALVAMTLGIVGLIAIRRLEGLEEDRRAGIPLGRAALGRLLFDLPRGKIG
ncbi:MAG: glycerol-3-phosphate acyltransferase [Acidobacteria bacterium]|nr:glycerol-3-phosphate acyltransferase [Acidobacteriota bacterium]